MAILYQLRLPMSRQASVRASGGHRPKIGESGPEMSRLVAGFIRLVVTAAPLSDKKFLIGRRIESMPRSAKEQALAANYEAFEKMLPDLLKSSEGKFALLRERRLEEVFSTAAEAHSTGKARFDDGLFSVQKIKEGAVSLGFFSYARYCRAA